MENKRLLTDRIKRAGQAVMARRIGTNDPSMMSVARVITPHLATNFAAWNSFSCFSGPQNTQLLLWVMAMLRVVSRNWCCAQ